MPGLIQDELNPGDEFDEFDKFVDSQDSVVTKQDSEAAEFDTFIDAEAENKSDTATYNLYNTKGVNPDQAAKVQSLAEKKGLPHDVVNDDYDELQHEVDSETNNAIVKDSDALKSWLSNPDNAKLSSDDINTLNNVDKKLKDTLGSALYKETVENFGDRSQMVAGGLLQKVGESDNNYIAGQLNKLQDIELDEDGKSGVLDFFKTVDVSKNVLMRMMSPGFGNKKLDALKENIRTWGQDIFNDAEEELAGNRPVGLDAVDQFIVDGVTAMEDMGLAIAAGFVTKNPSTSLSIIGTQVYGRTYGDSIKMGLDPARASGRAVFHTLAEVIPESIPVAAILRKGSPILRRYFDASVGEAVQEMLTSVLQDTYDDQELKGMTLGEAIKNLDWTKVGRDGLLGMFVGTGLTSITLSAETALDKISGKGGKSEIENTVDNFKELKDIVLESKTYERHKEKFEEFVNESLGTETDPNIYFDASEVDTLFQSREESPKETLEKLGVDDSTWSEAVGAGSDIKVPLSKFLSLAETDLYDPLLQDLKINAGDSSLRDEIFANEQRVAGVFEDVDKIVAEAEDSEAFAASAAEVSNLVRTQLNATNKFTDEAAGKYAALHEAFAVTLASKLNVSPLEAYQRANGLRVQSGEVSQVAETDETTFNQDGETDADSAILSEILVEEGITDEEYRQHFAQANTQTDTERKTVYTTHSGKRVGREFTTSTAASTQEGDLLVLHRGSRSGLHADNFLPESLGQASGNPTSGLGVFFTTDIDYAATYGNVEKFHLDIRNPKYYTLETEPHLDTVEAYMAHSEQLRAEGHDGIVVDYTSIEAGYQYIAFNHDQVVNLDDVNAPGTTDIAGELSEIIGEEVTPVDTTDLNDFTDIASEINKLINGDVDTFYQRAERNHMRLWSAVEQAVLDMPLPQWKAKPKVVMTDEERARLIELQSKSPVVRPPEERAELKALEDKSEKEIPAANGNEIWAKLKKTPGVKQEELTWLGIEDYLKSKKKFSRDEVASFVRANGVEVSENLAEGESSEDAGEFDWEEEIDTDEINWEGYVEDYLMEFDDDPEADFYFFDRNTWMEENIDRIVDSYRTTLPEDAIQEIDDEVDIQSKLSLIEGHNFNVQNDFESEMRDDFEEAANKAAEEQYMESPYVKYTDEITGYVLHGNNDVGFSFHNGNGIWNRNFEAYSFEEAQIQATQIAYDEDVWRGEDDVNAPRWEEYIYNDTNSAADNYRELKITLPSLQGKGSETTYYNDVHFPDANLVTFLRLTDRTLEPVPGEGSDYLSTYFIEEFQSDWHQQGRQTGYQVDDSDAGEIDEQANAVVTELNKQIETIFESLGDKFKKTKVFSDNALENLETFAIFDIEYEEGKAAALSSNNFRDHIVAILRNDTISSLTDVIADKLVTKEQLDSLRGLSKEADTLRAKATAQREGVLDAPFKGDGWISLGLKRAIIDAVERGKDSLAWADANVLADRWSDRYRTLYETQYDKKMPSIVKKLTKQKPVHMAFDGESHETLDDTTTPGYWIVPITEELKQKVLADGFALYQNKKAPQGQIQLPKNAEATITLFESADMSTFLHESGHFFLQAYRDLANESEDIKDDLKVLTDWMGVSNSNEIGIEQHEQFARGFEAYLFEGKAPSTKLQKIFDSFRAWLIQVYKNIRGLNVELNDDVRAVMDRMLATDEAIKDAQQVNELLPMFDADTDMMTASEYESYAQSHERATNAAIADADAVLMSRAKTESTKAWKEERDTIRNQVLEELYSVPANQARWYFMRGTLPNGDALPGLEPSKLSRAALIEMYGNELDAVWRKLPFGKYSVWTKNDDGVHPDEIAPLFGFANGDAMVTAMVETKGNLNKVATEEADRLMREKYGDPDSPEAISRLAMEVVQNKERNNFLSIELKALEKRAGLDTTPRSVINRAATRIVNNLRIGDIREGQYLRTANKWSRKAIDFAGKQQYEESADAKRKQLLNHAIYLEAIKARKYVEVKTRYFKKFDSPGVRKNLERDYLDQIDNVLEEYEFKKATSLKEIEKRKAFVDWYDAQAAKGLELIMPKDILERSRKRSYKDLPYEEFIGLVDTVKNIEHIAKFKQQLIVGKEKRDFNSLIQGLVEVAVDTNTMKVQHIGQKSDGDHRKAFSREYLASHVKMEFLLQQLDGNKPNGLWWNSVFRPLAEAEDAEINMSQDYMNQLNNIFAQYGNRGRAGLYKENVVGSKELLGRNIKRSELISIALNWGNLGNRKALLRGEGWTEQQIQKLFDDNMTELDWETVQQSWNLVDSLWPEISKLQRELTGVVPEKVEPATVITKFGKLQGGYYPLSYDKERSDKAFKYEEKMTVDEMFGGNYTQPSTRKGHTIERAGSAGMAVKLELDVLSGHLINVIHDLTHRKAIMQADHILQNPQVAEVIKSATSPELYNHVRPWLASIASDTRPMSGWLEKTVGRLRRGATAVNMGWKVTTAIVQPLGYLQSIDLLGAKYATKGLAAFYGNPIKAKRVMGEVFAKSTMMANRSKTFDRDIRDAIKRIKGDTYLDKVQRSLFAHIGFMDYSVSIPTWLGAYEKNMDVQRAAGEGITEADAIAYADSIVRMSQSAGGAKDLAAIQRGSETQRAFVMFYSYFSVLHNLIRRRAQLAKDGGVTIENITETTMSMLYLVVLPAVLAELIVGRIPGDEDDDQTLAEAVTTPEFWIDSAKLSLAYPFMTMVGARDAISAHVSGYTYKSTPLADAADSVFMKSPEAIFDAVTDLTGVTDEEFDRTDVKNLGMSAGYLFGLPSRQLYISGEHLYSVLNDEEEFSLYEFAYRDKRE